MKSCNKVFAALLVLITVLMLIPLQAFAAGNIDLNREGKMTVSCFDQDVPLADVEFSIYLVASVDENGALTPTESFKDYNVNIPGKNDEAWNELITTLDGYILRDKIAPTDTGKTNEQGIVSFPSGNQPLTLGLYLVMGSQKEQGDCIYTPQSFLVMVPTQDASTHDWNYELTVHPKLSKVISTQPDVISRKVLKKWDDTGHYSERPTEVVIDLLCNGEVYDTVKLNKDNFWRHTWDNLDEKCTWTVVERELDKYTVSVSLDGITFVVTNTYKTTTPTTPGSSTTPGTGNKLPQTGQLWWPVPVLAAVGMLFVVVGLLRRKYENE